MTTEGLGRCIEECQDPQFQALVLEDTADLLWVEDCRVPTIVLFEDELEYWASSFGMADVLDISWSACANGLN